MSGKEPMDFCEFTKCHWGERRFDLGACGTASSGETCYSIYPDDRHTIPRLAAYEIHLEEVRLNNE